MGVRLLATAVLALALPGAAVAAPARLAFSNGERIVSIDADGSNRTVLSPRSRELIQPAWAPDGSAIAVTSYGEEGARIAVMAPDGSGLHALTPSRSGQVDLAPAWSPDGRLIAFGRLRFSGDTLTASIVTVPASGGREHVIRRRSARRFLYFSNVNWSPDGRSLVYTRTSLDRNADFRPDMLTAPAAGGKARLLLRDADSPSFSPDGRRMAYVSVADRNGRTCGSDECSINGEIYVRDVSGGRGARLTRSRANDAEPVWSPNGQRIAFSSDRNYPDGQSPEIYSMRTDGSCVTWLTNGSPGSDSPAWRPDPQASSDPGGCGAVARSRLVEVGIGPARRFRATPAYWLGPIAFNGLLLSNVDGDRSAAFFEYGDCGAFDPRECPSAISVDNRSECVRHPPVLLGFNPVALRRIGGSLAYTGPDPDAATEVYAGRTVMSIGERNARRLAAILRELRRVDGTGRQPLPRSAFPRSTWRKLDRVARARRRLGSVRAVARRLHLHTGEVRGRLAVRRELVAYGARRLRC